MPHVTWWAWLVTFSGSARPLAKSQRDAMAALRSFLNGRYGLRQPPPDQLLVLEPPVCWAPFSTAVGGRHYIWRGAGPGVGETSISVYDPHTELWTMRPTTGPTPPGLCLGECTAVGDKLFTFGGQGKAQSSSNDLHKLDLGCEPFKWTKVAPTNHPSEWPFRKEGCGLVSVDEGSLLGCFGGYGIGVACATNEFHLFDLQKG